MLTGVAYSQRLIATFFATLATVLFINGAGLFGLVGSLLYMLVSVPVAYVYMRFGALSGVGSFVLSTLVLSGLYGLSNALFEYVLLFGFPSVLLPYLLNKGWRWDHAVAVSVAATVILSVGMTTVVAAESGSTLSAFVDQYVATQMDLVRETLPDTADDLTAGQQRDVRLFLQELEQWFRQAYPAIMVMGFSLVTLLQVWLLSLLSGRYYLIPGDAFVFWKAPEALVWLLILSGFLFFVAEGLLKQIGLNLSIVLLLVYYVQGLAIVTDLFERKQFPTFLRFLGYAMALLFNPLPFIVAGIGVFDLWIDFRKKRIKGN